MAIPDAILEILSRLDVVIAGELVSVPGTENGLFVPVRMSRSGEGRVTPSGKTLAIARQEFEKAGYLPEFLLVDDAAIQAEEGLRASLLASFPQVVRNAFLSIERDKTNVWIDTKRHLDDQEVARLQSHINKFCEIFSIPNGILLLLGDSAVPTRMEVISVIRQLSPVGCDELRAGLLARNFSVPSLDWVNRQFDLLRKAGFIMREHDRRYVLTLEGLRRLGTSKSRRSPDIQRLLALARGGM